jgi:hypothetical protein
MTHLKVVIINLDSFSLIEFHPVVSSKHSQ